MRLIGHAEVLRRLRYCAETGEFTWKECKAGQISTGTKAGSTRKDGYVVIKLDGKAYKAHRLAWFYMTGQWPTGIDHINREPSDNRWENLRLATHAENCRNRVYANSTGYPGVGMERNGRFRARVKLAGKRYRLGVFATAEEAFAAVQTAKQHFHGAFATCTPK